jgi:alkylhydroperoxidase family enzyme
MAVVNPVSKEKAPQEIQPLYDNLAETFGRMPNIFAVMAHRPTALQQMQPFDMAVMSEGTVEQKYKELAYVKTDMLNGCEY